jgi:hypothetical protein
MFNLAIDSKLRACDLTKWRMRDICPGERVASRATVMQQKTQRPVQFEITELTRDSAEAWIKVARLSPPDFLSACSVWVDVCCCMPAYKFRKFLLKTYG